MVQSGNEYHKSIVTRESLHSCAIQVNGLLDCWGDNSHFQLTGDTNPALFITVNSKIPLLTGKAVTRRGGPDLDLRGEFGQQHRLLGQALAQRFQHRAQPRLRGAGSVFGDQPRDRGR